MDEESLQKQMRSVIERMMLSGWVRETAHGRGITASELSADGRIAVRLLQQLLTHPDNISSADLACFLALVKNIPPETSEDFSR